MTNEQKSRWYSKMVEVLTYFNFEQVANVMKFLHWEWADSPSPPHVPTKTQIMEEAVRQLEVAIRDSEEDEGKESYCASGGFYARCIANEGVLALSFYAAEWETEAEEGFWKHNEVVVEMENVDRPVRVDKEVKS